MKQTEILVIGGGPAGLSASFNAANLGAKVLLVDRNPRFGGQLFKQTHKFFGSKEHHASVRGFDIANMLLDKCIHPNIQLINNATALGYYKEDGVVAIECSNRIMKIKAKKLIIATGAQEKFLAFQNNDLPGIYGAGAVQTLMNEYGIRPGNNVLMVGAGNIGLIVSYQLLQAGVNVKAVIEAGPSIGGYLVHASKLRRAGVPIYTSHTILKAHGKNSVEAATIARLDSSWNVIAGTERKIDADVICISVGLSPLVDILWQSGCDMAYVPELGGNVPLRDENLETSISGIYVAGDACGVEEASAAMIEGQIAGINSAISLGYQNPNNDILSNAHKQLSILRDGPHGEKILKGLSLVKLKGR